MSRYADLGDVLFLMQQSSFHKNWNAEQIDRCIYTPMKYGQYGIIRNDKGFPVVFGTWAYPTQEEVNFYLRFKNFPTSGFKSQGKKVWMIDFISKKGYTLKGVKFFRDLFKGQGHYECLWLRMRNNKIGHWNGEKRNLHGWK
jgi:hemolysin-activating ACP:hemolysin acyltransferase